MADVISFKQKKNKKMIESLKIMAKYFSLPLTERTGIEQYMKDNDKNHKVKQ
jgi:hypothetical protein